MSGETNARDERAANRRRRRGGEGLSAPAEAEASPPLQDALKAAASAAAVGAAVGAARAYSSRRHDSEADAEQTERAQPQDLEETDGQAPGPEHEAEPATEGRGESQWGQDAVRDELQDGARREEASSSRDHSSHDESVAPPAAATHDDLRRIVAGARGLLQDLDGKDAESVSSVSQTTGGWKVALEVVEVSRIPDSMDVLATYEVELDPEGGVRRIDRVRRYRRSDAGRGA